MVCASGVGPEPTGAVTRAACGAWRWRSLPAQ